jgi:hypothetical protein
MSEPTQPAPPAPGSPSDPETPSAGRIVPSKYVDFFLYVAAAVSYISLSIYNKWLLDWIVGPFWLVAWVWGIPALVNLVRRRPVRPQRNAAERSE